MFGSRKNSPLSMNPGTERFDTLVGAHTEIQGQMMLRESARIDGRVVGNIDTPPDVQATVVVSSNGEVRGDITAYRVLVAGKVAGQIHARERVELQAQCVVQGDIKYGSIATEHGARIMGLLLQLDESSGSAPGEHDAQQALRKAQAS
jgi:cytoskeletal protein CcmA (bactofilin family)